MFNFVAVKIGDVNGNAQTNVTADAGDQTFHGHLNFNLQDAALVAGEEYSIDFKGLMGYQVCHEFQ